MSAAPVEIMQVAVVSTAHLSEQERSSPWKEWPIHCHESEYGFIVYVGIEADELLNDDDLDRERWPGLFAAAKWAHEHEIEWVRFDCDADKQEGLPTFEDSEPEARSDRACFACGQIGDVSFQDGKYRCAAHGKAVAP